MNTTIKHVTLPRDENGNDPNDHRDDPEFVIKLKKTVPVSALDRLRQLSATTRIAEMEKNLKNDFYIIDEMAIDGQITLFFAMPGTGKTLLFLWFIIKGIRSGRIDPASVFYINADDHYKGLLTKSRIAEKYGFNMISPAEASVSPKDILRMLDELSASGDAAGKIIFLDTLKKFADMMNKRSQADLYEILRRLVAKNSSVVIAGHANKHPDVDGNLVYEGTSDTLNDVDCMYAIYRMTEKDSDDVVVEFRNIKDRGDVIKRVSYGFRHADGMNYYDMLESVHRIDSAQADAYKRQKNVQAVKKKYESEQLFISELLGDQTLNQSQIIKRFEDSNRDGLAAKFSKRRLLESLDALTDIAWTVKRSREDNNAKHFSLIESTRYQSAKWGEK